VAAILIIFLIINLTKFRAFQAVKAIQAQIFVSVIQWWIRASDSWSSRSLAHCRRRY